METDFIYWRHPTPVGIKVEEVSGGEDKTGRTWTDMAIQIYAENGKDGYREVGHFASGAPFLSGSDERISVSHTPHLLVVATLPPVQDVAQADFNPLTALGIDVERIDRRKAVELRQRFLNPEELNMIDGESVEANVLAWTIKEAVYKAALREGVNFRRDIRILKLPVIHNFVEWNQAYFTGKGDEYKLVLGHALLLDSQGETVADFNLYSYISDDTYLVTLAFMDETMRFKG